MNVYIIGAGGHSKQIIDVFKLNNIFIKGIFDDNKTNFHYNIKIIDKINMIHKYLEPNDKLFCAIGNNNIRKEICNKFDCNIFINCIHPLSFVSDSVKIGNGNYIGSFVSILGDTVIGNHNILNDGCKIPHDNIIGNFNHISLNVTLGGNVNIGDIILIGLNSTILPNLYISDGTIIGGGTVITKNIVEKNKTIVGNPFRYLK